MSRTFNDVVVHAEMSTEHSDYNELYNQHKTEIKIVFLDGPLKDEEYTIEVPTDDIKNKE